MKLNPIQDKKNETKINPSIILFVTNFSYKNIMDKFALVP